MKRIFSDRFRIFFATVLIFIFCISARIFPMHSLYDSLHEQLFKASLADNEKTNIMILGTPHLESLGAQFKSSLLDKLLSVLEQFKPDLIGIESIPPSLLEDMERRKDKFGDVINEFAKLRLEHGHIMQQKLGVTRKKAEDIIHSLFLEIRDKPEDFERRSKLVQCLLASYDDISALVQWSYLPESFRLKYKDLPTDILTHMNNQLASPNEIISIGVTLARRLHLERVKHIDDHHDKDIFQKIAPQLIAELENNSEYLSVQKDSFYRDSQQRLQHAVKNGDLLPYYAYINSLEYVAKDMELQWNLWFRTKLQSGLDRSRMALWEVRNLNIASHIRRATVIHPGKRMIVIIGVGHKPFLEAYLSQMVDMKVVQLKDLLDIS